MSGGAAGSVKVCTLKTANRPCGGQGMNTPSAIDSFATQMVELKGRWSKLTPAERKKALQRIVDDSATSAGFLSPSVKIDDSLAAGRNGELSFDTWEIAINKTLVDKNTMSDEEFEKMANTIYHETRHAEQWWLIMRRDAAEGLTAEQIIAKRGVKSPIIVGEAVSKPLRIFDARRACADAMYQSVYGADATARNETIEGLSTHRQALNDAIAKNSASQAAYKRLEKDGHATAAAKQAALDQWQNDFNAYTAAKKASDDNYAAYRALPEEADAWESGDSAGDAVRSKLKK